MRTEEWIFYTAWERLFFKKQFHFVGHSVIHKAFTVDNSIQEHACLTVEIVSYCLQPRTVKIVSNVRNVSFLFGEIWLNMWYLQTWHLVKIQWLSHSLCTVVKFSLSGRCRHSLPSDQSVNKAHEIATEWNVSPRGISFIHYTAAVILQFSVCRLAKKWLKS